jgi:hypothetical protein
MMILVRASWTIKKLKEFSWVIQERVKDSDIEALKSNDEEDLRPTNKLISPQKTSSPQKERAPRNSPQKVSSQEPALKRSQRERRPPSDF